MMSLYLNSSFSSFIVVLSDLRVFFINEIDGEVSKKGRSYGKTVDYLF